MAQDKPLVESHKEVLDDHFVWSKKSFGNFDI